MDKYNKIYNEFVNRKILQMPGFLDKLRKKLEEKYIAHKYRINLDVPKAPYVSLTDMMFSGSVGAKYRAAPDPIKTFAAYIDDKLKTENSYMDYSDMCLIALTEAPTQDILRWSSRIYEQNGINTSIYRAISTGYHDPDVWKSIIFQLQNALYVLHKKNICIWDFNLENNVFIKETNFDNNNIGHWRYIINDIEFYVPNYGAILLVDTNFKDLNVGKGDKILDDIVKLYNCEIDPPSRTKADPLDKTIAPGSVVGVTNLHNADFRYKIMMTDFFDNDQAITINDRNKEKFKNIFSRNEFKKSIDRISGAIAPDESILAMIENISKFAKGNDIENIITNHGHFLHNRMGTLLNKTERPDPPTGNTDFKTGELVGYTEDGVNYRVVMIYKLVISSGAPTGSPSVAQIIKVTKDNNNNVTNTMILPNVDYGSLIKLTEKLKQVYKPNIKLGEEDLIETYEINF